MTGTVFIKDLLTQFHIGIDEEERRKPQDILINIELSTDMTEAVKYDTLEKTVDYQPVYKYVLELTETSRFTIIETLANTIANYSLVFNPRVQQVRVSIEKPRRINSLRSVGIEIIRIREI
jgi:FolB domain-containing protein